MTKPIVPSGGIKYALGSFAFAVFCQFPRTHPVPTEPWTLYRVASSASPRSATTAHRNHHYTSSHFHHHVANDAHCCCCAASLGMGREDEATGVRSFCFGLLMVNSSFATLVVFDLLLLSHSLIFTLTNYVSGEAKYSASTFMISSAIAYKFLLPLLIVQVFWLLSCLLALVALKALLPYLQLPYLLSSGAVLATLVWIIVSTVQALARASTVEWTLALLLCFANIVFLVQCYFIYVKFACFKVFIRKRKAVTTTERESGKMAISAVDNQFDTYSTKSTVIITDDFLRAPPR